MAISKSTKSIVLGGVFFLIPLLLIIILFKHALELISPLIKKLIIPFHIHTLFGTATITIFSVLFLLFICYLSGLLLKLGLVHDWSSKMEDKLFLLFPSLQMLKYKLLPEEDIKSKKGLWKPILMKEDHSYTICFITQKHENGFLSIYIPDAPKMDAGEIRIMHQDHCEYTQISMKLAMQSLNSFGRDGNLVKDLK